MTLRQEKVAEVLKRITAQFLQIESGRQSLITVTNCRISPDLRKATVFISVLPEDKEEVVLKFVKRKRTDLRDYLKSHTRLKVLPFIDIQIDLGEKNRQKIDELSKNQ
ncbi:MAG: hypothetical protein BMS9Abin13_344 [Patescibacteria group bacterium]|nr:MAG: hypothetical protein BMS9Abin13_344 [Patescibacteria group bacterium]